LDLTGLQFTGNVRRGAVPNAGGGSTPFA